MAIHLTGLSNQGTINKSERAHKDDAAASASEQKGGVQSGGTLAEDTVKLSGTAQTLQNQQAKLNTPSRQVNTRLTPKSLPIIWLLWTRYFNQRVLYSL